MQTVSISMSGSRPLSGVWRNHAGLVAVVCASSAALLAVDRTVAPGVARPLFDLPSALLAPVLTADLALLALAWRRVRTREPWGVAWAALRTGPLAPERLLSLALVIFTTRWLLLTAVAWKSSIPMLHPFAFDVPLARLDALLHGGAPARWFTPPALVMRTLDAFYYAWFLAFAAVMLRWGWAEPGAGRQRFLLSMALLWTVGSLAAVLVSSAGPAYYSLVTGEPSGFDGLALRVQALELTAGRVQRALWESHLTGPGHVVAGIAAFPSLHVAVPALCALSSQGWRRWLWWAFTALTLLGSVALLWHYALDGYAGILIAAGCWWAARAR